MVTSEELRAWSTTRLLGLDGLMAERVEWDAAGVPVVNWPPVVRRRDAARGAGSGQCG